MVFQKLAKNFHNEVSLSCLLPFTEHFMSKYLAPCGVLIGPFIKIFRHVASVKFVIRQLHMFEEVQF